MRRKSARYSQGRNSRPSSRENDDLFPMLPHKEILETLRKFNILIDERNLNKPNEQIVTRVFETLLHVSGYITSFQNEEYSNIEESLRSTVFVAKLRKMFRACKIERFNYYDIIKPDSKAFKRQLCAWINFQRFRNARAAKLNPVFDKSKELVKDCKEAVERVNKLKEKKNELYNGDTKMSVKLRKYQDAKKLADEKRHERKKLQEALTEADEEHNKAANRVEEMKNMEDEVNQSIKQFSQQIVPSPQRLKDDNEAIQTRISDTQSKSQEYKLEMKREKEDIKHLRATSKGQTEIMKELKSVQKVVDRVCDLDDKRHDLNNKIALLEVEAQEKLDEELSAQERYDATSKHFDQQISDVVKEEKEFEVEIKKMKSKIRKEKNKLNKFDKETKQLKAELTGIEKKREENRLFYEDKENAYKTHSCNVVNALAEEFKKAANIMNS